MIDKMTPLPVQMETFWPSNKNKAGLETVIYNEAKVYNWPEHIEFYLSSFCFEKEKANPSCKIEKKSIVTTPELENNIEEADLRLVLHAFHASNHNLEKIVILSNDTDVLVLFTHHWKCLETLGLKEVWITAGTGASSRFIPIHMLAKSIGETLCSLLPAVHVLTGCDYTSKFGTKMAAIKASPQNYLMDFGNTEHNIEEQVAQAEKYLVQVKRKGSDCSTLDQLRYHMYHQSKSLDLPPTSSEIRQHISRSMYAVGLYMIKLQNDV